jgi:putative aldouronate transport system substrate-binding protein
MKNAKKAIPILVCVTILLLLLVSAGGQDTGSSSATAGPSTLSANDRLPSIVSYPLKNAPKITYWVGLATNLSASYPTANESPYAKGLVERTGIPVEFIHPAQGMELEQFNLLVASGKMPDIVEYNWLAAYNGGPDAAIRNQLILSLNDVMDKWAPDYKKFVTSYPNVDKMVKTDTGNYYGFPLILLDDPLLTTSGPIIRQDWLDELGLQKPETIDEWTAVLRAFKDRKGASAPLALLGGNSLSNIFYQGAIIGAYKTFYDMYMDNGIVKYGPSDPAYKDAVRLMNSWYREGLLDKSFASNVQKERDANILNGNSGVTFGYTQSSIATLNTAFKDIDPKAQLRGFKYPALKKGEIPWFGQKRFNVDTGYTAAINPKGSNIETAVKFVNYGYTQSGIYYHNFGIEGVSYKMINGFPTMEDFVLKPTSESVAVAWTRYARAETSGAPTQQSLDAAKQYLGAPELQSALADWVIQDTTAHLIPPVTVTIDESRTYNKIKSDLNAYVLEWTTKAITGAVSVDEFDTVFLRTLREIGVDQAVAIQQAALARFNKR